MTKLLMISGSPVKNGSVDLLLKTVAQSIEQKLGADRVETEFIRLNRADILPCQACGKSPAPEFCFYDDAMTGLYRKLIECDCLLVGSPIYFDSVSAQLKLFLDRCCCMRPIDFESKSEGPVFVKAISRRRPGGIILVGSEGGYYEGARRTIAGFFKWIEVDNQGMVSFATKDTRLPGLAVQDAETMRQADELSAKLAERIETLV